MQSSQNWRANDPAVGTGRVLVIHVTWNALTQPLMWTRRIDVIYILFENSAKMRLSKDDDVIEALAADAPEKPLAN